MGALAELLERAAPSAEDSSTGLSMEEPMSIPNSIYCTTQWKGHVVQLPTGRKKNRV